MFSTGKWPGLDICAKCPISSVAHVINYSLHVSHMSVSTLTAIRSQLTFFSNSGESPFLGSKYPEYGGRRLLLVAGGENKSIQFFTLSFLFEY